MQQTFKATILNGIISATDSCTPLEIVILQAAKRKHRNGIFMRFLLAELLQCHFIPSLLPTNEFAPLLEALTDLEPIQAINVEINSIYFRGPNTPLIIATAEFALPVRYQIQRKDWTYEMSMCNAFQDAVRFYWTWRDVAQTINSLNDSNGDSYHLLIGETVAFEMTEE
jgi:hypothetical protein